MRKLKSKRKKKVSTIDPFCNIQSRRQLVVAKQNQLNQAPDDPDDQPITARQREIMRALSGETIPKKKKKKKVKRLDDAPVQPLGRRARKKKRKQQLQQQESKNMEDTIKEEARQDKLKRLPGESDKKFMRRINTQADAEIRKEMDEIRLLGKHAPDVLDDLKEKKVSKKDKERFERLKEKREEKKKNKLLEKKIDKLEDQFFKDKVEFGEVAGRPPELSFQPRKSQPSNNAGQRNLLLSNIMKGSQSTSSKKPAKGSTQKQHKFKRRKEMDNAEKRIFDKQRQEAINAYRQAKADAMEQRTMQA